jgi:predicted outer membrane protein
VVLEQATEGSMRKSVRKTILFWSSLPVLSGSASLRKALTADEQTFIEKAATSEQTEIRLSQLAVERASSPEVKQFAQSMVTDQSASLLKMTRRSAAISPTRSLGFHG